MRALIIPASRPRDDAFGFSPSKPAAGDAHRAALGRGLAFVLILAATSMAAVCAPMACPGPRWIEGTAPLSSAP